MRAGRWIDAQDLRRGDPCIGILIVQHAGEAVGYIKCPGAVKGQALGLKQYSQIGLAGGVAAARGAVRDEVGLSKHQIGSRLGACRRHRQKFGGWVGRKSQHAIISRIRHPQVSVRIESDRGSQKCTAGTK